MITKTSFATISRRGVERLRAGHPWVYRSDVVHAEAEPGDTIRVLTERERPLGWAWWSSSSQIAVRMISSAEGGRAPEDLALLEERMAAAAAFRETLGIEASAFRLVHAESDRLPSVIVDRYGDGGDMYFVVQTLSQASDRRLPSIVDVLVRRFGPRGVIARNDPKVRRLEGLDERVEVLAGEVPERVEVREGRIELEADLRHGQKTGLFLDQRENHAAAARYARGRALDAFAYHGGFALQLAPHVESVLALDASAPAVETIRRNALRNGLTNIEAREANVFDELRELDIAGERFDTIVLDPPAFAKNRGAVPRALGGYKEINLRALRLLRPGGHLVTCSCSYHVGEAMFRDVLADAAADAGAMVTVAEHRGQARDHPVLLSVPETSYLKCFVLRRVE